MMPSVRSLGPLFFGLLIAGLLCCGEGIAETKGHPAVDTSATSLTSVWGTVGIGAAEAGRANFGLSGTVGFPVSDAVFIGGRYAKAEELLNWYYPTADEMWDVGPVVGLYLHREHVQLSVASGVVFAKGQRVCRFECGEQGTGTHRFHSLGFPIDIQAFWLPSPYVGLGLHLYTTRTAHGDMRGLSLTLIGRLPGG